MIYTIKQQKLKLLKISFLAIFVFLTSFTTANASGGGDGEKVNIAEMITHHISDSHEWHFFDGATLYLPVILYSSDRGVEVFSSSNFYNDAHETVEYNGYKYEHGHIIPMDSSRSILDFSITKNVASLFITAALMLFIFLAVAKGYKKNAKTGPRGIQSFFEPIIVFVRDEVVKPNIGPKYERFLPYMLTLFFFIWIGNILGLLPGAANLTGNVAVTAVLAIFTFVLVNVNGNKGYWGHIFNTPGVPWWLKPVMIPVEVIGIFTKPISLALRLFVAITAGHIVLLSLIGLTFLFHSVTVGIASSLVVTVINFIEILVATIQAYVFTMFSSLYIGMAVADHDDH
ncbi:MAG: F0F1 ATP synthase subunit A [Bacteroidota bacterium]